jgi:hypothetical protein
MKPDIPGLADAQARHDNDDGLREAVEDIGDTAGVALREERLWAAVDSGDAHAVAKEMGT